jgi:hypothetical protein
MGKTQTPPALLPGMAQRAIQNRSPNARLWLTPDCPAALVWMHVPTLAPGSNPMFAYAHHRTETT